MAAGSNGSAGYGFGCSGVAGSRRRLPLSRAGDGCYSSSGIGSLMTAPFAASDCGVLSLSSAPARYAQRPTDTPRKRPRP